jgi:hypothetical protein
MTKVLGYAEGALSRTRERAESTDRTSSEHNDASAECVASLGDKGELCAVSPHIAGEPL